MCVLYVLYFMLYFSCYHLLHNFTYCADHSWIEVELKLKSFLKSANCRILLPASVMFILIKIHKSPVIWNALLVNIRGLQFMESLCYWMVVNFVLCELFFYTGWNIHVDLISNSNGKYQTDAFVFNVLFHNV